MVERGLQFRGELCKLGSWAGPDRSHRRNLEPTFLSPPGAIHNTVSEPIKTRGGRECKIALLFYGKTIKAPRKCMSAANSFTSFRPILGMEDSWKKRRFIVIRTTIVIAGIREPLHRQSLLFTCVNSLNPCRSPLNTSRFFVYQLYSIIM